MGLLFIWQEDYVIDQGEVDKEHLRLFELANTFMSIDDPSKERDSVKDTIKQLFKFLAAHFKHEEELMKKVAYPCYEEHYAIHRKIIKDMNAAIRKCKTLENLVEILKRCMFELVVEHVMKEDQKIARHIETQKAMDLWANKKRPTRCHLKSRSLASADY